MIKTIAIVGPESSGKSSLALELAAYFKEPLVLEYARTYLSKQNGKYTINDLACIAKGQLESEKKAIQKANQLIIADTSNIDIQVWSKIKYGYTLKEIYQYEPDYIQTHYLLTEPDLPYEAGVYRERPKIEDRIEIFDTFFDLLIDNVNFLGIVNGIGEIRFKNALERINSRINI
ncbi:MAG: ATPase [Bacteroidetes bacterium]|nr:MAG: ATPase [Bacteroidota bacterium]MBL1144771.1 ATPase [Bacteroidota bacterium]NOG57565.1 ATP-binding protein [Bacteroidota bacterium]